MIYSDYNNLELVNLLKRFHWRNINETQSIFYDLLQFFFLHYGIIFK